MKNHYLLPAIALAIASFCMAFYGTVVNQAGRFDAEVMGLLFQHSSVLSAFISESLGASLFIPVLIALLLMVFRKFRSWRAFSKSLAIGCGVILAVQILTLSLSNNDKLNQFNQGVHETR